MRRALVLVCLFGVAVFFAVLMWRAGGWPGASSAPDPRAAIERTAASRAAPTPAPRPTGERTTVAEEPSPADPEAAPDPIEPPDERILVRGTAVLVDERGDLREHESGHLRAIAWRDNRGQDYQVTVVEGLFEGRFPPGVELSFGRAVLGGRDALFEGSRFERFPLDAERSLDLRFRTVRGTLLHVIGADTGAELEDLTVVHRPGTAGMHSDHPGRFEAAARVLEGASSPVLLAREEDDRSRVRGTFHVRAAGYAWGRIELDFLAGGDRVIVLEPAGGLAVTVDGPGLVGERWLRLRPADFEPLSPPVFERPLDGPGSLELRGLAAGSYVVSVETGSWFDRPGTLAAAPVDLVAGRDALAGLHVPLPAVLAVELSGTLTVPEGWDVAKLHLEFERLETPFDGSSRRRHPPLVTDPEGSEDLGGRWTWDAGSVEPGKWRVRELSSYYALEFELAPEGPGSLDLVLPAPARVEVELFDEVTGEDPRLEYLVWGWTAGEPEPVRWRRQERDRGVYAFAVPEGTLHLNVADTHYSATRTRQLVRAGPNAPIRLGLRRTASVLLVLRDGPTVLPWSGGWTVEVECLDGEGAAAGFSREPRGFVVAVDRAGRWRLHLPEINGYLPIPPLELELREGRPVERVVELERRF